MSQNYLRHNSLYKIPIQGIVKAVAMKCLCVYLIQALMRIDVLRSFSTYSIVGFTQIGSRAVFKDSECMKFLELHVFAALFLELHPYVDHCFC